MHHELFSLPSSLSVLDNPFNCPSYNLGCGEKKISAPTNTQLFFYLLRYEKNRINSLFLSRGVQEQNKYFKDLLNIFIYILNITAKNICDFMHKCVCVPGKLNMVPVFFWNGGIDRLRSCITIFIDSNDSILFYFF